MTPSDGPGTRTGSAGVGGSYGRMGGGVAGTGSAWVVSFASKTGAAKYGAIPHMCLRCLRSGDCHVLRSPLEWSGGGWAVAVCRRFLGPLSGRSVGLASNGNALVGGP